MLADPQSVTINAVAKSMPATQRNGLSSVYGTSDNEFTFKVSHQPTSSRERHMVRLDQRKIAADPISTLNFQANLGVYLVIDQPLAGFTDTEIDYLVQGLKGWLSSANVLKVLGGES